MNEASISLESFIKSTIIVLSILGIAFAGGAYYFYQKGIVEKADIAQLNIDIDSVSDTEVLSKTLESIPKVNPEDELTQDELKSILKNNQIAYDVDEALAEEERVLILKNNTIVESTED